jgi:MOSC domain-containing protein YiiM
VVRLWVKRFKGGPMDAVAEALLEEGAGLAGNADRKGRRQVTIIEQEVWERHMAALGGAIDPSARRANILVRGCSLRDSRGRTLRIGEARLRIYGETRPCERMDAALPGLRAAMQEPWGGGAFGEVTGGGIVRVDDVVHWADL